MRGGWFKLLVLFWVASLAAIVVLRQGLGLEVDPFWAFAAFLAMLVGAVAVAKHPAAFIAPMLFAPRLKELPVLNRFEGTRNFTALAVAAAIVGLAVFLRFLWLSRRRGLLAESFKGQGKPILAYLLFMAIVAFSYIYTPSPFYGGDKLVRFLGIGGLAFFAPFFLLRSDDDYRDFTVGTLVFALGIALSSLGFSHQGVTAQDENVVHIGIAQLIGLALLLLLYHKVEDRRVRALVLLVGVPWLAFGLVSAESRGPLLSLLFVLVLSVFVRRWPRSLVSVGQMALVLLILCGALSVMSIYWFTGAEQAKYQSKASEIVELAEGSSEAHGTATQRLTFYRAAFSAIADHPILGWGVGGWSMFYYHQDDRTYPHNLFLEVAVEEGIVGLAVLLILFRLVYRELKDNMETVGERFPSLLPVFIYLIGVTMFSGDIDDNRFLWFWCGLAIACCGLTRSELEQASAEGLPGDLEAEPLTAAKAPDAT